jgi:hypothetical protein
LLIGPAFRCGSAPLFLTVRQRNPRLFGSAGPIILSSAVGQMLDDVRQSETAIGAKQREILCFVLLASSAPWRLRSPMRRFLVG